MSKTLKLQGQPTQAELSLEQAVASNQSEAQFQAAVIEYATVCGWLIYHTHDSRRSNPGFPDLVLCRSGAVIFVELKSQKGRVSAAQQHWLDALPHTRVWRPSDWNEIEQELMP